MLRCGSWNLLKGYRVSGRGEEGVCGDSDEETKSDRGEDEAVTVESAAVRSRAHRAPPSESHAPCRLRNVHVATKRQQTAKRRRQKAKRLICPDLVLKRGLKTTIKAILLNNLCS